MVSAVTDRWTRGADLLMIAAVENKSNKQFNWTVDAILQCVFSCGVLGLILRLMTLSDKMLFCRLFALYWVQ